MKDIAAIILAAGLSTRMGRPKLLLAWKDKTIIWEVISTLSHAGIQEINVVIQKGQEELFNHLRLLTGDYPLKIIFNDPFHSEDMLTSIQVGLRAISPSQKAALITLGDQPLVQEKVVQLTCSTFKETNADIIIPSYQSKRGHPWLISQKLWPQFLGLKFPSTPRDFLNLHQEKIHYVLVNNPSILMDIDTPDDYEKFQPRK